MPKTIIPDKVVAEYSQSQNCFHVHSLKEAIEDGLMSCLKNTENDYVLIGIFDDDLQAHEYIENIRKRKGELKTITENENE